MSDEARAIAKKLISLYYTAELNNTLFNPNFGWGFFILKKIHNYLFSFKKYLIFI